MVEESLVRKREKERSSCHGFGLDAGTSAEGWINDAVAFWKDQM